MGVHCRLWGSSVKIIRLSLYFVLGLALSSVCVMAFAAPAMKTIVLKGPNSLPFNQLTQKYVGISLGDVTGGAALTSTVGAAVAGLPVIIDVVEQMGPRSIAKTAAMAMKSSGGLIVAGLALELALNWNDDTGVWEKPGSPVDTGFPQGGYRDSANPPTTLFGSPQEYCDARGAQINMGSLAVRVNPSDGSYECYRPGPNSWQSLGYPKLVSPCSAGTYFSTAQGTCVPATPQPATDIEIEDAVYVELVAKGMGSDLARRLIDQGYQPDTDSVETSGPASSTSGPVTTTTTGPTGTTTTVTQTTYNYNYQGDTVTVTPTTTVTTTGPDGTTTTETTTVPAPDEKPESYGLSWMPTTFPPVPDFYTQKYPQGFSKAWDDNMQNINQAPAVLLIDKLTGGAPSSGVCPTWPVSFNLGALGNYGTADLAPPCSIWPWIKAILLVTAFFAARKIIFGG